MASFVEAKIGQGMILFTRPDYDPVTKYLSAWARILIIEAREKAICVFDLEAAKANKKELEGRLKKKQPSLVVLSGHGDDYCVTGQDDVPLVEAGVNADVLAGTITYAVSCNSASQLGRKVGTYPSSAYIGYEKKFSFVQKHGFFKQPINDPIAKPFMEFSNQVVRSLIKGHTAKESVNRAKEVGESYLQRLGSSESDPDAQMSAAFLWRDISCLVVLGDCKKQAFDE